MNCLKCGSDKLRSRTKTINGTKIMTCTNCHFTWRPVSEYDGNIVYVWGENGDRIYVPDGCLLVVESEPV